MQAGLIELAPLQSTLPIYQQQQHTSLWKTNLESTWKFHLTSGISWNCWHCTKQTLNHLESCLEAKVSLWLSTQTAGFHKSVWDDAPYQLYIFCVFTLWNILFPTGYKRPSSSSSFASTLFKFFKPKKIRNPHTVIQQSINLMVSTLFSRLNSNIYSVK